MTSRLVLVPSWHSIKEARLTLPPGWKTSKANERIFEHVRIRSGIFLPLFSLEGGWMDSCWALSTFSVNLGFGSLLGFKAFPPCLPEGGGWGQHASAKWIGQPSHSTKARGISGGLQWHYRAFPGWASLHCGSFMGIQKVLPRSPYLINVSGLGSCKVASI